MNSIANNLKVPGTVAITYDDGPSEFSNKLLDIFEQYNGKATFFINGNNKGRGDVSDPGTGWPATIKRMDKQGHQIGFHTGAIKVWTLSVVSSGNHR